MSSKRRDKSGIVDEVAKGFGRRLRAERKTRGMTLKALAGASGYSEALICKIENGRASPSFPSLIRLADALEVTPGSMLEPMGAT